MAKDQNRRLTSEILEERLRTNKSLAAANPGWKPPATAAQLLSESTAAVSLSPSEGQDSGKRPRRGKKRREMNATEREFSRILDRMVDHGELVSWDYEGMSLRWGEGAGSMTYTPDFCAIRNLVPGSDRPFIQLVFFEVKGAHAWQKDIIKFKAARANWELFEFQLHEKTTEGWVRTI